MRHRKSTAKLGRTGEHRNAMLANLVRSLIKHKRITTTLAKAKATRPVAEKMLTLGKRAQAALAVAGAAADRQARAKAVAKDIHCPPLLAARLHAHARTHFKGTPKTKGRVLREKWRAQEDIVHILCDQIAPVYKDRAGGYTRIIKLAQVRRGDAGQRAILEWVNFPADAGAVTAAPAKADEKKP